jgi:predicted HTH transcriptional regulator
MSDEVERIKEGLLFAAVHKLHPRQAETVACIIENAPMTAKQVAEAFGVSLPLVSRRLVKLVNNDIIQVVDYTETRAKKYGVREDTIEMFYREHDDAEE